MGRTKKMKKVRTLDDLYKGDKHHDDAPVRDSDKEIEIENRKLAARLKKEQRQIASRQRAREAKSNDQSAQLGDLKIQPKETLRQFNDRVNMQSRLLQSAQAKQERNQRRKQKRNERDMNTIDEDAETGWSHHDEDDEHGRGSRKRSLPRFLDVADRPPELEDIYHNKKRFVDFASATTSSKEQQMAAMVHRVQGLYKGKGR